MFRTTEREPEASAPQRIGLPRAGSVHDFPPGLSGVNPRCRRCGVLAIVAWKEPCERSLPLFERKAASDA